MFDEIYDNVSIVRITLHCLLQQRSIASVCGLVFDRPFVALPSYNQPCYLVSLQLPKLCLQRWQAKR